MHLLVNPEPPDSTEDTTSETNSHMRCRGVISLCADAEVGALDCHLLQA